MLVMEIVASPIFPSVNCVPRSSDADDAAAEVRARRQKNRRQDRSRNREVSDNRVMVRRARRRGGVVICGDRKVGVHVRVGKVGARKQAPA